MNMSNNVLKATVRANIGKGAARKSRKAGLLPAVVYSKAQESVSVELSPRELTHLLRLPLKRNALIDLDIEGQGVRHVMIRDIQKHPVRRDLMHIDFLQIDPTQNVVVEVPISLSGRSASVASGGNLELVRRNVTIACLPGQIPAHIDLDITNLAFGSTFVSDITLPEGLSLEDDPSIPVVTIRTSRGLIAEEEEEAAATAAVPAEGATA
jgi:large subunit ribosomal protein L25